jgi:glutamate dehydrogenase
MPATIQQVTTRIAKEGGADAERLAAFAERLFAKADEAFLEQFDADALYAMARDGLAFVERLGDSPMIVEARNPTYRADGWEAPFTILRLALTDRPFIVDSVRNELRRQGVELVHLLHPIYSMRRDADGRVEAIVAFELFVVEREDDPARLDRLTDAVRRVLGDVILATDDYQAIRARPSRRAPTCRSCGSAAPRGATASAPKRSRSTRRSWRGCSTSTSSSSGTASTT